MQFTNVSFVPKADIGIIMPRSA